MISNLLSVEQFARQFAERNTLHHILRDRAARKQQTMTTKKPAKGSQKPAEAPTASKPKKTQVFEPLSSQRTLSPKSQKINDILTRPLNSE